MFSSILIKASSMDNNYSKNKHTFSKPYISVSDETGFLSGQIIYYLPPTPQPSK